jgi:hypothetical protein
MGAEVPRGEVGDEEPQRRLPKSDGAPLPICNRAKSSCRFTKAILSQRVVRTALNTILPEDHLPTVIARCQTRQDVQLAIRTARTHGLAISVRGGDSGSIGRVLKRGGMVIDLSAMRHVAVDPATRVAIVAGAGRRSTMSSQRPPRTD